MNRGQDPGASAGDALDEYRVNIDLWKHDDTLRQSRNQTFLTANSAALVAAGLVISASDKLVVQAAAAVAAAVFGFGVCRVWRTVQARHNAYITFHRLNLVALERATGFSTFTDQQRAFHEGATVEFASGLEKFTVEGAATRSSSKAEARLPLVFLVLWAVAGLVGAVVGVLQI